MILFIFTVLSSFYRVEKAVILSSMMNQLEKKLLWKKNPMITPDVCVFCNTRSGRIAISSGLIWHNRSSLHGTRQQSSLRFYRDVFFCLSSKLRLPRVKCNLWLSFVAELRRPEGPSCGAPYSYGKQKETHKLIFSRLSWLVVLLVGAYARRRRWRRRRRWSRTRWLPYSK